MKEALQRSAVKTGTGTGRPSDFQSGTSLRRTETGSDTAYVYFKASETALLDEHTAALDPKTARKVLELTAEMVNEQHLTALMVTHNMKDAIQIGNRLIMMNSGHIIYDVEGEEKKKLTVEDLLAKFSEASGEEFSNDRMMLAK